VAELKIMVTLADYGQYETAWCPGCGNFQLLKAVKQALADSNILPHQVLFVAGIGQAAKAPHYLNANFFNGLHGRSLPAATGAKLANPNLKVIAESGDGCNYGEGGNHLLAAIRRNPDITLIVHDNQVYGLTKGQASPTSEHGFVTKAQPAGYPSETFNPIALAVSMHASFVARGFTGMTDHLAGLLKQAIAHKGFSIVDVLQPCVTFNKVNTFAWYKSRCYELKDFDPANWDAAIKKAYEWDDKIPIGVIYKCDKPAFEENFEVLKSGSLVGADTPIEKLENVLKQYQ